MGSIILVIYGKNHISYLSEIISSEIRNVHLKNPTMKNYARITKWIRFIHRLHLFLNFSLMSIFIFSLGLFLAAFYIGYKIGEKSVYDVIKNSHKVLWIDMVKWEDTCIRYNTEIRLPKLKRKLSPGHKKKLSKVAKSRKRVNGRFI